MYVYANCNGAVYEDGLRVQLEQDQIWDANDPFVKKRPDLFSATPRKVNNTTGSHVAVRRGPVESATAAPGEKRAAKRG